MAAQAPLSLDPPGSPSAVDDPAPMFEAAWQSLCARAEQGDAQAQWERGYCAEYGAVDPAGRRLIEVDLPAARCWYEKAADQGELAAYGSLSNLFSNSAFAQADDAEAIRWGTRAADLGSATAAYNVGIIHRDRQDLEAAWGWYAKAAAMGDADALLQMALCLIFGIGVAQDRSVARLKLDTLLRADPTTVFARSIDDANYWLAVLDLIEPQGAEDRLASARKRLLAANVDNDHEAASQLLNLIGRQRRSVPTAPTPA